MKDKILEILEQNRGVSVSGVEIGNRLRVNRTAVWKNINALKKIGHKIRSTVGGGYILHDNSDVLYSEGISRFYSEPHETVVFKETDSTNKQAKIMALNGAAHMTVVAADKQTAGKGRRGRSFFSPAGSGAYFSIILRPKLDYTTCQRIVPMAAVATSCAIKAVCGIDVDIKWVNDLYYGGKKIAGISTESSGDICGSKPDFIVLGIGINVNTKDFPQELKSIASSLDVEINRNKLIAECVNRIVAMLPQLSTAGFMEEYRKKCFVIGKDISVYYGDARYEAHALGIDDNGALIVDRSGTIRTLIAEEVSVREICQQKGLQE